MTNLLIDIVLVGIVAFAARKRIARQRAVLPPTPARQPVFVPREPPKAIAVEPPKRATAVSQTEPSAALPAYLLSGRRSGAKGDSMAETLAMMSGPGICTPRPR